MSISSLLTNLSAYWKFDEASGNAADSSGNSITLTNNNTATYVAGKINNTLNLVASSSQFMTSTASGLAQSGSYSLAGWVNFASLVAGKFPFVFERGQAGTNHVNYYCYYQVDAAGYTLGFNNGTTFQDTFYSTTPSTGTYYHLAIVFDSSAGKIFFYVNATEVTGGISLTGTPDTAGTQTFNLGINRDASAGRYWDGKLDEWGEWGKALTGFEVFQLYNGGSGEQYSFTSFKTGDLLKSV